MDLFSNYIPKEHLALKINYCRQQLDLLPAVTLQQYKYSSNTYTRVSANNHRYRFDSENGKYFYKIYQRRTHLENQLRLCEAIWDTHFKDAPNTDCEPHQANRVIYIDTNKPVIMNREYFDSLKNDADNSYPKPDNYQFNGIKYRSAAEKEIAIFYTEMGIPFKYEPEVYLKGLAKAVHPDFVTYIEELDNCKFHEHFGMKDYADYVRNSKIKFSNFAGAGLIQDLDVLFTHSNDDTFFDPRHLSAKLNAAVYGTICMNKPTPGTICH